MITKNELKAIAEKVGVDCKSLPNNLKTTICRAILTKLGYDCSCLPNNLTTTMLKEIGNLLEGVAGGGNGNTMNLSTYATQDELDRWYDFLYYDSLKTAITDINNGTIGTNATNNSDNAEVILYARDTVANIMLLKNINLDTTLEIVNNVNFILNGYKLKSSTNNVLILKGDNSIIDGRIQGSEIINNVETGTVTTIKVEQGHCKITGGKYITTGKGGGTPEQPDTIIFASENTTVEIDNAILQIDDENGGTVVGILSKDNTIINVLNCQINATSKRGYNVCGLYGTGTGEATFTNCQIIANADHTANEAGNNYATMSRAIHYEGTLYLYDCYVYGTHSGITPRGDITIKGGMYEGYSHGGVYIASGVNGVTKTVRLYDAILRECPLTEGYIDDGVAGTNKAGIYIGGTSNTTIYIDNCDLYAQAQVIVMKNDRNNTLYISRSFMNKDYTRTGIRIDSSTHKVYIGQGCNFVATNTDRSSVVTETTDIYRD